MNIHKDDLRCGDIVRVYNVDNVYCGEAIVWDKIIHGMKLGSSATPPKSQSHENAIYWKYRLRDLGFKTRHDRLILYSDAPDTLVFQEVGLPTNFFIEEPGDRYEISDTDNISKFTVTSMGESPLGSYHLVDGFANGAMVRLKRNHSSEPNPGGPYIEASAVQMSRGWVMRRCIRCSPELLNLNHVLRLEITDSKVVGNDGVKLLTIAADATRLVVNQVQSTVHSTVHTPVVKPNFGQVGKRRIIL